MDFKHKYLKYKNKYLHLQNQFSGGGVKNACIALLYDNKIYLVKNKRDKWNIPGGGIDKGEISLDAAFREFYEETGGFDLKKWANLTKPRKEFSVFCYNTHTDIWWHISSILPNIQFKTNNEMIDGKWYDINNLPPHNDLRFPDSIYATLDHIKQISKSVAQSSKLVAHVAQSSKLVTPVARFSKSVAQSSTPVASNIITQPILKQNMLTYICVSDSEGRYPNLKACENGSN